MPKKLLCLFLCIVWVALYEVVILYPRPPFFPYRNFRNYNDYLSFVEAFNSNERPDYPRLENELRSLDVSKL